MADQVTTSLAEAKVLVMEGKAGFSPQIEVRDIDGGHQIRITTKISPTQYETQVFNVLDGTDGAPGQPGTPGASGLNGADGFSPTVEVQDIVQSLPGGGTEVIGHKVIITDAAGAHTFNVMNGEDGDGGSGGSSVTVDAALSTTSENPVQNKVITNALNSKGTYSKPAGGIPASDLTQTVKDSLDAADAALPAANLSAEVASLSRLVYALSVSGTTATLAASFSDFYAQYSKGLTPIIYLPYGGGTTDPIAMEMRVAYVDALERSIALVGEHNGSRYTVTLTQSGITMAGTLVATPLNELPAVTAADNGKFLRVVNGAWAADTVPSAESNSFGGGS